MTQIDIAALVGDREAGTKGPWFAESGHVQQNGQLYWQVTDGSDAIVQNQFCWCRGNHDANARRIARVPDMEAALIAQDAEIDRLTARAEAAEAREGALLAANDVNRKLMLERNAELAEAKAETEAVADDQSLLMQSFIAVEDERDKLRTDLANAGSVMVEAALQLPAYDSDGDPAGQFDHHIFVRRDEIRALSTLSPIAAAARVLLADPDAFDGFKGYILNRNEMGVSMSDYAEGAMDYLRALAEQENVK